MLCPFCCAKEQLLYVKETDSYNACCEGSYNIVMAHIRPIIDESEFRIEFEKAFKDMPWKMPTR